MTKEEIRQAAQKEFAYQVEIGSKAPFEVREGFIKGAEWMQERMIEKATEWLKEKFCSFWIEDFKQAMQYECK